MAGGMAAAAAALREGAAALPVSARRREILDAVAAHRVLVLVGETGSGKTTQIPQFLVEAGYAKGGKQVAVTQPRRVAAMSVARRVAQEMGVSVGEEVGFKVRFHDRTSSRTKVKFLTDGSLVRECLTDRTLSKYSVIMLDEAHERSLHTDVLFGLVKQMIKARKDLKVIVTSATLDVDKFSAYMDECPRLMVSGRTFPVKVLHSKQSLKSGRYQASTMEKTVDVVMNIHTREDEGDVLVFLTGQAEIDKAVSLIADRVEQARRDAATNDDADDVGPALVLPLYGALPSDRQARVFEPAPKGTRKIVIATNIAETSVTVDGIRFVVDPGFVKEKHYDASKGMESLLVVPVSKVSAAQRAGRAGRTGPGKCFRLYNKATMEEMLDETIPEIRRTNLANTVLYLKIVGVLDVLSFNFIDPPPEEVLVAALKQLYALGALDRDGNVTPLGKRMAELPLEPSISRMLLEAVDVGCAREALSVAALMSATEVFYKPPRPQGDHDSHGIRQAEDAKRAHARFYDELGDDVSQLRVYAAWLDAGRHDRWCRDNFIHSRAMRLVHDVRRQLLETLRGSESSSRGGSRHSHDRRRSRSRSPERGSKRSRFSEDSRDRRRWSERGDGSRADRGGGTGGGERGWQDGSIFTRDSFSDSTLRTLRKCIAAGFFQNSAELRAGSTYKLLVEGDVRLSFIHPASVLSEFELPKCVVYNELVQTSRPMMRGISAVKYRWLRDPLERAKKVNIDQLCSRKPKQEASGTSSTADQRSREPSGPTEGADGSSAAGDETANRQALVAAARERFLARQKSRAVS